MLVTHKADADDWSGSAVELEHLDPGLRAFAEFLIVAGELGTVHTNEGTYLRVQRLFEAILPLDRFRHGTPLKDVLDLHIDGARMRPSSRKLLRDHAQLVSKDGFSRSPWVSRLVRDHNPTTK